MPGQIYTFELRFTLSFHFFQSCPNEGNYSTAFLSPPTLRLRGSGDLPRCGLWFEPSPYESAGSWVQALAILSMPHARS